MEEEVLEESLDSLPASPQAPAPGSASRTEPIISNHSSLLMIVITHR